MRALHTLFFILLSALAVSTHASEKPPRSLSIITTNFSYDRLQKFMQHKGISEEGLLELNNYQGEGMFRETAELILAYQALRLGGISDPIEITKLELTGPQRFLQALSDHYAVMMGESLWKNEIDKAGSRVLASTAVVEEGEFLVGIYTRADNRKALAANSLDDFKQLSFVSNRNWAIDWTTLQQIGIKKLYSTNYYKNVLHMIRAGRADAMLSSFPPADNLQHSGNGKGLVPIANVRIALAGTKHFPVSATHPDSERVYAALERGLALLRSGGKIEQAYQESGFYHPRTRDWPVLNRE